MTGNILTRQWHPRLGTSMDEAIRIPILIVALHGAIDQQAANAGGAHFGEGDLLWGPVLKLCPLAALKRTRSLASLANAGVILTRFSCGTNRTGYPLRLSRPFVINFLKAVANDAHTLSLTDGAQNGRHGRSFPSSAARERRRRAFSERDFFPRQCLLKLIRASSIGIPETA